MRNKIAVCEFSFPCLGPVNIELASRAGFDGIQLIDCFELSQGAPLLNPYVRNAYLEAADRWNIEFQGLHLYSLCHADIMGSLMDSPMGQVIKDNLRNSVETCRLMNISNIMVNFNGHHLRYRPCKEQWDNATEALQYAYRLCEDSGVTLTIETLHSPQQFFELREKVGPNLKLCFDTMIPVVHNTGVPAELIQGYGIDAIDHFHVHDVLPDDRGYFAVHTCKPALIGEGQSGFWDCARVINDTDFRGWFVSESVYMRREYYPGQDTSGEIDYLQSASRDVATLRRAFVDKVL